jgi:large subunit ribosomal protein L35
MLKLKTRKAAIKRYKKTKSGKFLRRHAYKGHLLRRKSNKQKRKLSTIVCVHNSDVKAISYMLPY